MAYMYSFALASSHGHRYAGSCIMLQSDTRSWKGGWHSGEAILSEVSDSIVVDGR